MNQQEPRQKFYSHNFSTTTITDGTALTTITASTKGFSRSRMCTTLVGAVLANAHMAREYFVNGPAGRPREHKAEFLRDMARDIILDEDWKRLKFESSRRSARLAAGEMTPEAEDRWTVCELKNLTGAQKVGCRGRMFPGGRRRQTIPQVLLRRHNGR